MPRGKPLSAAHKAAISAGLKRYYASRGSGSGRSRTPIGKRDRIGTPRQSVTPAPKPAGAKSKASRDIINIDTGKPISREEAAIKMFGAAGAARKLAASKRRKGSFKR